MCIFTSVYKQCAHTTQLWNPSLAHLFAVSEHVTEIVQREYYPYDKYKSPQTETPTSNSWEGGGGVLKSNTQSAKICLNFNWGGGVLKSNTKSGKICLNFNFWGGGGGVLKSNTQSAKICLHFNFFGEGVLWNQIPEQGCSGEFGPKIYCLRSTVQETCLCITDSLPHATYVETNN